MIFGLIDDGDDGEKNNIGLATIAGVYAMRDNFSHGMSRFHRIYQSLLLSNHKKDTIMHEALSPEWSPETIITKNYESYSFLSSNIMSTSD